MYLQLERIDRVEFRIVTVVREPLPMGVKGVDGRMELVVL
jgi:hypothetical protein